mmetsp:Transcript_5664/g.13720  ORF Transcript_5664/g.13720 Transcript_5664/m.13720 type:complete len:87 (+) Transcript_5664:1823-2083(+)
MRCAPQRLGDAGSPAGPGLIPTVVMTRSVVRALLASGTTASHCARLSSWSSSLSGEYSSRGGGSSGSSGMDNTIQVQYFDVGLARW